MAEGSEKMSSSPKEDYNPLADNDLVSDIVTFDLVEEDRYLDEAGSPGSSIDQDSLPSLEPGSLDRYAVTPPSNIRALKRYKEKSRSTKQKHAQQEAKEHLRGVRLEKLKTMQKSAAGGYYASDGIIDDVTCGIELSTSPAFEGTASMSAEMMGALKRRNKDISKPFKTSRSIDRDMKMSSGDLASLDSSLPAKPIKVDTPNRFRSLHSKPVVPIVEPPLNSSTGNLLPHFTKRETSYSNLECPHDRIEFYRTFSTLVNLGNSTEKKKKEDCNISNHPLASSYTRQMSSEQEYWQNQYSDLIWLELQAWFKKRSMNEQDMYLMKARDIVPPVLEEILNFKVRLKNNISPAVLDTINEDATPTEDIDTDNDKTPTESSFPADISSVMNSSFGEGSKLYSEVVQDGNTTANFDGTDEKPLIKGMVECITPQNSYLSLQHTIADQKEALIQVADVLNKLEKVRALYPTSKALGKDNQMFNTESFQNRLNALCLWLNITKDIGNKLSLMATVLYVDNIACIDWPWLDYESPNQIIQKIRDGSNTITPDIIFTKPDEKMVSKSDDDDLEEIVFTGCSDDKETFCDGDVNGSKGGFNDGLSDENENNVNTSGENFNDGLSDDTDDPREQFNDGLSDDNDSEPSKIKFNDGLSDDSDDSQEQGNDGLSDDNDSKPSKIKFNDGLSDDTDDSREQGNDVLSDDNDSEPPKVKFNDGLSDDDQEPIKYNDGLSDDEVISDNEKKCNVKNKENLHYNNNEFILPSNTVHHKFNDGLSSEDGDSDNDKISKSTPQVGILPLKPNHEPNGSISKSCKNVRFYGVDGSDPTSVETSPADSSANLLAYSPTETSTPIKKDFLLTPSRQISNTSSTMSRTSSTLSFDDTKTSIYRHFVDRHLKKMGLRKLLRRLKSLLDGTLQRARQALERPMNIPSSPSLDLIVQNTPSSVETQSISALSSSPSMDGLPNMPDVLMEADRRKNLITYGTTCKEFQDMNLPSFKSTYLFLVRIPLDVVHECLRLRLEQRPETEPSLLSVKQLIRECKEVLLGAVMVKQYYQSMVSSVIDENEERTEVDLDQFEEDLRQILDVYFDYTQTWMSGLQKTHEMSKRLKTFLEDEWKFTKEVCPHVRGGEASAGDRFCLMESSLLGSISDFLESGMDECINKLYDSTLIESMTLGESLDSSMYHCRPVRVHSRSGEVRQAIIQTCRNFKETFNEARERASKALGFAKMLRKDLEIAADFNVIVTAAQLLNKLEETNHVRVIAPYSSGYLMFIPEKITEDKQQILQLLNVTCGREDQSSHAETSDGYLLLLKCEACLDQQRLCPHWTGKRMRVEPNADTTIALSHIEVEGLLLIVLHSSRLASIRRCFEKLMESDVTLVTEQTSCHQAIAGSLSEMRQAAMELRHRIADAITQVDQKLTIEDMADLEENEKVNIEKLYRETLHQCYNFGFDYHREVTRLVSGEMREELSRNIVQFAKQWMIFVTTKCERGRGVRPRWAKPGLDFLIVACEPSITAFVTSEEFHEFKSNINKCIMHLIGDKSASHLSPGSRVSSPLPDTQKHVILRNFSCPETRTPNRSYSNRSVASDSSTPVTSEPDAPLAFPFVTMRKNSSPSFNLSTQRQSSDVEIIEGEDGGIVLDIHQHIDPLHEDSDSASKIGGIRNAVQKLEQRLTNRYFKKQQIGRVTQQQREVDYHITNKKVNFKWQRGNKIGEGNFGKVYTAVNMDSGELLAMKEIRFPQNDHQTIKEVAEEIKIFETLKHPSLVRYYGVEVHRDEMLIFMEYCAEGTVEEVAKQGLSEELIRKYTSEILTAVTYLHENNIVHRDIKGANIFLTSDGPLKLGDFGCAIRLKNHTTMPGEVNSLVGTTAFMAPEVIKNEKEGTGRASDIWSLGCVVIEMSAGKRPWHDLVNNFQIMYQVGTGGTPAIPQTLSEEGKEFLSHCLVNSPVLRWSASQLQDHPFVKVFSEDEGDYDDENKSIKY